MGTKEAKAQKSAAVDVIFKTYSRGVATCRDAWTYNFNRNILTENIQRMMEFYNAQVLKWLITPEKSIIKIDNFVSYDDTKISWSSGLKQKLKNGRMVEFSEGKLQNSLYRPFTKSNLYLDRMVIERVYVFPSIFPTPETEMENRVICVSGYGRKEFAVLMSQCLPDVNLYGDPQQSFPFYTYDENGANRQEKHHRLGVIGIPNPLRRQHHHQVGHLPLQLWSPAPSHLS